MNTVRCFQSPKSSGWFKLIAVVSLVFLFAMGTATSALPQSEFKVTTVYLVRHAEKAAQPAAEQGKYQNHSDLAISPHQKHWRAAGEAVGHCGDGGSGQDGRTRAFAGLPGGNGRACNFQRR